MDRLEKAFHLKKSFIGYLTAGDGGLEYSINCALALVKGGVDILEIGMPFSDPVADGPVIQAAHERSLAAGTNSSSILEMAKRLRKAADVPLILFSYYNPLLQRGNQYLHQLKSAGFDAVLVVDLPVPDEGRSEPFFEAMKEADLIPILLATPSTGRHRLMQIGNIAKGFLYYVAQKGTTGIRNKVADDLPSQMTRMRQSCRIPIVAGFGIADRVSAKEVLEHADGFVVGSAFVKKMGENIAPDDLVQFTRSLDPR